VLRPDLPSHRRSPEPELLEALRRREPLALAEACSRTLPVAYAVARRLLAAAEVEPLLLAVYAELWEEPPADGPLERWVRARTTKIGLAELRRRNAAPAVPSVLAIAPDLTEPSVTYLDTTERTIAALDDADRTALLRAHDQGLPSAEQGEGAGAALMRGLRALADPDEHELADDVDADGRLADWVLGLLPADEAAELAEAVGADPVRTARTQVLRRGRRRIEGLPPTPDLGPRLLAAVLTAPSAGDAASALDAPAAPVASGDLVLGEGDAASALASTPDEPVGESTEDLSEAAAALAAARAAAAGGGVAADAAPDGADATDEPADDADGWGPADAGGDDAAVADEADVPDDDADDDAGDGAGAVADGDRPEGDAAAGSAPTAAAPAEPADDPHATQAWSPADMDADDSGAAEETAAHDALADDPGATQALQPEDDPYAPLREDAGARTAPRVDPDDPFADLRDDAEIDADDPYAALREDADARDDGSGPDTDDDPWADDVPAWARDDEADAGDGAGAAHEANDADGEDDADVVASYEAPYDDDDDGAGDVEDARTSPLVRLLQAVGILVLIGGGIGLGLLLGQVISAALQG
jgi:hypothetical protein